MSKSSNPKILEIYNDSNEFQKLVFIEVLRDLLKPIENKGKSITGFQLTLLNDQLNSLQEELKKLPPEILSSLINEINSSFPEYNKENDIVPFVYNKAKIHFGHELRKELISIGKEEISEIHIHRKIIILNLEKLGIIEKYSIIEDSFLDKMIKLFKEELSKNHDEGETKGANQDFIDIESQQELENLCALFGEEVIEEAIKEVIGLDMSLFSIKKDAIIEILSLITGKEQDLERTEFNILSGILLYKGEEIPFKKGGAPNTLLKLIFESTDTGLRLYDAHSHIDREHILDRRDYYEGGKEAIESIVKGINRRIRKKFPKHKFLEIRESSIRIVK